jgi:hypothetical protein
MYVLIMATPIKEVTSRHNPSRPKMHGACAAKALWTEPKSGPAKPTRSDPTLDVPRAGYKLLPHPFLDADIEHTLAQTITCQN